MTNADVLSFVELEIASRAFQGKLDDAVRSDWARAIWKAGSIDTARQIVRGIVDEPETSLSVKTFYRSLRASGKAAATSRDGVKYHLRYSTGDEREPFRAYAVRQGERPWVMALSYPVARLYADGVVVPIDWTAESLRQAMCRAAQDVKRSCGGEWILEIAENKPDADGEVRRRWVPKPQLRSVPAEPQRQTAASREMIDRLRKPLELTGQPLRADEDWFAAESEKLRAEELATYVPPEDEIPF